MVVVAAPGLTPRPVAADGRWRAFVDAQPGATYAHDPAWRGVVQHLLGHRCTYLAAVDEEGVWHGVLPLAHVRSRLFGDYLVSMPFGNGGGALGTPAAVRVLERDARCRAEALGVDLLELRSRNTPSGELGTTNRKVTVMLDLPAEPEALWDDVLPAKVRSQVRRPRRAGFHVHAGPDRVDDFCTVYHHHMRDLGSPALPWEVFAALPGLFGDRVVFAVVEREGEPSAVGCGFFSGDTFELTWAAALRRWNREAPNMLLYWHLMTMAIARGARRFDFGRCTPGSGTHRFKRQWGGRDVPLPWRQWSNCGLTAPPTPDGSSRYRAATRMWQHLPLAITDRLGPWLARQIP